MCYMLNILLRIIILSRVLLTADKSFIQLGDQQIPGSVLLRVNPYKM